VAGALYATAAPARAVAASTITTTLYIRVIIPVLVVPRTDEVAGTGH
jgi:hypothetical protein